jgi:iron complex transport system permease protein
VVVYVLGSAGRGGATPVKLALAGVAVTALLTSLTSGISLVDPAALDRYRFWASGSLAGQDAGVVLRVLPFVLAGVALALASAPALNSLALGEDVATSLGRKVGLVRLRGGVAITLLTGSAVAVVGPIVFVGLVVPHVARAITGPDHRRLLPMSMLLAPIMMLAADIVGRVIARPGETEVGIVLAFAGAPFFIALVRRRRLAEL